MFANGLQDLGKYNITVVPRQERTLASQVAAFRECSEHADADPSVEWVGIFDADEFQHAAQGSVRDYLYREMLALPGLNVLAVHQLRFGMGARVDPVVYPRLLIKEQTHRAPTALLGEHEAWKALLGGSLKAGCAGHKSGKEVWCDTAPKTAGRGEDPGKCFFRTRRGCVGGTHHPAAVSRQRLSCKNPATGEGTVYFGPKGDDHSHRWADARELRGNHYIFRSVYDLKVKVSGKGWVKSGLSNAIQPFMPTLVSHVASRVRPGTNLRISA